MSKATTDPAGDDRLASRAVETLIEPRQRDVEGLPVRRLIPVARKRLVGPFVFFDHMGPIVLAPGQGVDVPPHPHINLATVTYLFEGELVHRDSIGSNQAIRPGEINWMTAGSGIAHSERTGAALRASGSRLHGIQIWVALPEPDEETPPTFDHYAGTQLPITVLGSARLRVLAGTAYGLRSPVETRSELFYVDAEIDAGGGVEVPIDHEERAAYVLSGTITLDGRAHDGPVMIVFKSGVPIRLLAQTGVRMLLLGGAPLGPRHIWWNFVSSSRARIEQAKLEWKQGRFAKVVGDEDDYVPLPESTWPQV